MLITILIILIIIIIFSVAIYIWVSRGTVPDTGKINNERAKESDELEKKIILLQQENEYLKKAIIADNHIFHYIRCINIPQTPACKAVGDGTSHICRSRLMDCNKIKLVLENDPIAVERMKVATNRFRQAGQPKNPSELTNPVQSWWFF